MLYYSLEQQIASVSQIKKETVIFMSIKLPYKILSGLAAVIMVTCLCFYSEHQLKATIAGKSAEGIAVPVIMYHHILEQSNRWGAYVISPKQFQSDLKFLKEQGYTAVSGQQLIDYTEHNTPLPEKPVLITFDDGYESNYTKSLPILEKYKVPALFFMVSDYINADGYLSAEQLAELGKNPYITIGSHTDKIHNLSPEEANHLYMSRYMTDSVINDISTSMSKLEAVCGKPVRYLSYPYGIYSQATDILLKQKYNGLITFCSREEKETLPCGFVAPLGRFNRSLSFQFK